MNPSLPTPGKSDLPSDPEIPCATESSTTRGSRLLTDQEKEFARRLGSVAKQLRNSTVPVSTVAQELEDLLAELGYQPDADTSDQPVFPARHSVTHPPEVIHNASAPSASEPSEATPLPPDSIDSDLPSPDSTTPPLP
jgi:hypothetical protein